MGSVSGCVTKTCGRIGVNPFGPHLTDQTMSVHAPFQNFESILAPTWVCSIEGSPPGFGSPVTGTESNTLNNTSCTTWTLKAPGPWSGASDTEWYEICACRRERPEAQREAERAPQTMETRPAVPPDPSCAAP